MFNELQIRALSTRLDPKHVQARQGMDYVEGWQVISEANRIFGFDGWSRETVDMEQVGCLNQGTEQAAKWYVAYTAKVRVRVKTGERTEVVREGTGYGAGEGMANLGKAIESATKEAETDAMKRALMTFGYPFGLALYEKPDGKGNRRFVGPWTAQEASLAMALYYTSLIGEDGLRAVLDTLGLKSLALVSNDAQWKQILDALRGYAGQTVHDEPNPTQEELKAEQEGRDDIQMTYRQHKDQALRDLKRDEPNDDLEF